MGAAAAFAVVAAAAVAIVPGAANNHAEGEGGMDQAMHDEAAQGEDVAMSGDHDDLSGSSGISYSQTDEDAGLEDEVQGAGFVVDDEYLSNGDDGSDDGAGWSVMAATVQMAMMFSMAGEGAHFGCQRSVGA